MGAIPTVAASAESMRRRWDNRRYPSLVYVETTNFCNARCEFCLYDRMERAVQFMPLADFKRIAEKVKAGGLKIGAVYCFGEPLADAGLFDKIRLGRSMGVLTPYLGLNSNVSLLTPEKFDDILSTCTNMTLSFVNVGAEFERLTRLDWQQCYSNALAFIKYRDQHKPRFQIEIGCNDVTGHDRAKVAAAFKGYRVDWARDAEIQWGGKIITGVIDRSIMYRRWSCDGHKGAMQIKPNGDCCFCAYDVVRDETVFANVFDDDWPTIEANFKALWRQPSSLCLRCDFWHNYNQMVAGGWQRGPHIDASWQRGYKYDAAAHWDHQHVVENVRLLTGSSLRSVVATHDLGGYLDAAHDVLNVGVGTGRCTRELAAKGKAVHALDISPTAIRNVASLIAAGYNDPADLPDDTYDLAICHLVAQHLTDIDLFHLLANVLRSLKPAALLSIQFASPPGGPRPGRLPQPYREDIDTQLAGTVQRTPSHIDRVVGVAGGRVVRRCDTKRFPAAVATDDNEWNIVLIARDHVVKQIGFPA